MALGFCARRLPGVLLFGLLGLLLHVALGGMYSTVAGLLGASPVAVLWQQLVLFAWIWIKFLRLAWAVGYTEGAGSRGRLTSGEDLLATSAHSDHSESSDNWQ